MCQLCPIVCLLTFYQNNGKKEVSTVPSQSSHYFFDLTLRTHCNMFLCKCVHAKQHLYITCQKNLTNWEHNSCIVNYDFKKKKRFFVEKSFNMDSVANFEYSVSSVNSPFSKTILSLDFDLNWLGNFRVQKFLFDLQFAKSTY